MDQKDLDLLSVNTIRALTMDAVQKANSGHPGMPMGAADMAYVLWTRFLRHNPSNPNWPDRDRFVLAAGHGSMLIYSLLYLSGYGIEIEDLQSFRMWGSRTPGHPEHGLTPGVETTTGPLGQGLANSVGMAIAERYLAMRYNRPGHTIIDHFSFGICGDGDLQEGVAAEAASLAGHLKLGKLIYLYDSNRISIDGPTDLSFTEDVGLRFQAYGWHVQRVDGYDHEAVAAAIQAAKAETERPSMIICRTNIARFSPNKQDTAGAHGSPLGQDEVDLTKQAIGWPIEPKFFVPGEALSNYRRAIERGKQMETDWQRRFDAWAKQYPDLAAEYQKVMAGELPRDWDKDLPKYTPDQGKIATRMASQKMIELLTSRIPNLLGGSADLAPSNLTVVKGGGDFSSPEYQGRNMHFGVREHAMGAIMNGMALHGGIIPYGATFLTFTDYMRPAMRLAALMEQRIIYVLTHDSIGLGEDGPTHQPIEHLCSLRAMPNMTVIRPADVNETVVAWKAALLNKKGPTVLSLTRHNVAVLDPNRVASSEGLMKGGYVLLDAPDGTPDVLLMGTGSEVQHLVVAYDRLAERGIKARVVSMPCFEFFKAQPQAYRDRVLPPSVTKRLAVEAGVTASWCRWVGPEGDTIGIDRFGASAPPEVAMEKFGFTPDNVVQHVMALLGR